MYEWIDLFWAMRGYEGDAWADDVVRPFLGAHGTLVEQTTGLGDRAASERPTPDGSYPFSRVMEVLISPFQPVNPDPTVLGYIDNKPWWKGRTPSADCYPLVAATLAAETHNEPGFHPFFHEIVTVVPAPDPDAPATIIDTLWPGYMLGDLLLTRAGVSIEVGSNIMTAEVAQHSPLAWAWYRRNRVTSDQSHGWGDNSQWSTAVRRDYRIGDQLHYNIDYAPGRLTPHGVTWERDPDVLLEILRFRHGLKEPQSPDNLWPWDQYFAERT